MFSCTNEFNLIVLSDNAPHPENNRLLTEHGLSIYFEIQNSKYLFDVGASDIFYKNALHLGIDIAEIDALFISHGHRDHTGGLSHFLRQNKKAKVYLSNQIIGKSFFSSRRGNKRDISMPKDINKEDLSRFVYIDKNTKVSETIQLISAFSETYPKPKGNNTLFALKGDNYQLDNFDHEIALIIRLSKGMIVLSACSHRGILNTLHTCFPYKGKEVLAYIGGTHLLNSDSSQSYESDEELDTIHSSIFQYFPNIELISGHCSGNNATKFFTQKMGDKFKLFYTGFEYHI